MNKKVNKYEINEKWAPSISCEYRLQLKDPRSPEYDYGFHRQRYQAGVNYKINNRHEIGVYYLYQNEFTIQKLTDIYILGIEYSIDI